MKHPSAEEWMCFIYGELTGPERHRLAAHLRGCGDCRGRVNEWEATQKSLNQWPLRAPALTRSAKAAPALLPGPLFKWAALALLLLGAGFALGQFASMRIEGNKLRAQIQPQIRQQLREEMTELLRGQLRKAAAETLAAANAEAKTLLASYAAESQAKLDLEQQALYTALRKVDGQRLADFLLLKKQLDTVAVYTDADLRLTKQQLIQLVDFKQPISSPAP